MACGTDLLFIISDGIDNFSSAVDVDDVLRSSFQTFLRGSFSSFCLCVGCCNVRGGLEY